LIPFTIALVIGAAAFALAFARRADAAAQWPVASLVGGAFLLSCAMFLPLVGWFVFLPIIAAMSAGAGFLSFLAHDPAPKNT
jgi:hypothetical protein